MKKKHDKDKYEEDYLEVRRDVDPDVAIEKLKEEYPYYEYLSNFKRSYDNVQLPQDYDPYKKLKVKKHLWYTDPKYITGIAATLLVLISITIFSEIILNDTTSNRKSLALVNWNAKDLNEKFKILEDLEQDVSPYNKQDLFLILRNEGNTNLKISIIEILGKKHTLSREEITGIMKEEGNPLLKELLKNLI